MKCIDRNGNEIKQDDAQNKVLSFLYHTKLGRVLLTILVRPKVSKVMGCCLSLPISKLLISPFVKRNKINLDEYENQEYSSYNDFFTRKIKEGCRNIDHHSNHLIAPCDGKLSVYSITKDARFTIKNTKYSMESLLRSKKLANRYEGGTLLLFRLTVDDYHRYCYIDNGIETKNYRIPGVFHTVNPIANDVLPIYKENTREFSILKSDNYGSVLTMEVGALLVGRIVNYHVKEEVIRGEEKGKFEFGGSTIIICLEKDQAIIDADILHNSINGIETVVKMGEKIGESIH
ncbi:phosphatidylserine decarboxylase [Anaeromicropila herbilytica]|uniref:Phosphatidylserine decarboxylase proenzyme 2 n=1 Tax=Anaeromicropila herbilytica TaxID=2785025 RepID=A0A7R7EIF3_9FIRM|nr:phosphatidylserine decarboxylase [Anaeromicropila herbilytica]BCN29300.1 phosphatidylserine decarboxylase proenzyme 2 [Anaeromicropila herbilytica]